MQRLLKNPEIGNQGLDAFTERIVSYSQNVVLSCPGYFPNGAHFAKRDWKSVTLDQVQQESFSSVTVSFKLIKM